MFVIEICFDINIVVFGIVDEFICNGMMVGQFNNQKYVMIFVDVEMVIKICYKDFGVMSIIIQKGDKVEVNFLVNVKGVVLG